MPLKPVMMTNPPVAVRDCPLIVELLEVKFAETISVIFTVGLNNEATGAARSSGCEQHYVHGSLQDTGHPVTERDGTPLTQRQLLLDVPRCERIGSGPPATWGERPMWGPHTYTPSMRTRQRAKAVLRPRF